MSARHNRSNTATLTDDKTHTERTAAAARIEDIGRARDTLMA